MGYIREERTVIPDGLKEKFDLYRKWLKTLLLQEFLNLPTTYQERFLILIQKFLDDCKRVYEEGKSIKEKIIEIKVENISIPDDGQERYLVQGSCPDSETEIRISLPIKRPKPKIGSKLHHTVYSLDETVWYSSKEELLTKRNQT